MAIQEVKSTEPLLTDGMFTAEIGTDPDWAFLFLDGNYQVGDIVISVDGTATMEDERENETYEGEFTGIFVMGYFAFRITFEDGERPFYWSAEGRYELDENGQDFQGEWGDRPGCWITGTFNGMTGDPTTSTAHPLFAKLLERPILRSIILRVLVRVV
jgi:hypothetical protein